MSMANEVKGKYNIPLVPSEQVMAKVVPYYPPWRVGHVGVAPGQVGSLWEQ